MRDFSRLAPQCSTSASSCGRSRSSGLANGWAFDFSLGTRLVKKLSHLRVHLVAVAGSDARTYARHGYFGAMKTQIDLGIFEYCGAFVLTSEFLLDRKRRTPFLIWTPRAP